MQFLRQWTLASASSQMKLPSLLDLRSIAASKEIFDATTWDILLVWLIQYQDIGKKITMLLTLSQSLTGIKWLLRELRIKSHDALGSTYPCPSHKWRRDVMCTNYKSLWLHLISVIHSQFYSIKTGFLISHLILLHLDSWKSDIRTLDMLEYDGPQIIGSVTVIELPLF